MNRRTILTSGASLALAGGAGLILGPVEAATSHANASGSFPVWRRFEISTRVTLLDAPGPAQLWLPIAQTSGGYQFSLDLRWQGTGRSDVAADAKYGARVLKVVWDGSPRDDEVPRTIELVQTVATCDRHGGDQLLPITAAERDFWRQPTESMPVDGIVRQSAERIVAGKVEPRARLRAIYDWVVDHTYRNPEIPGCGTGDIKAMLESGNFGGKCADINSLMTGLARAAGFPARDVYGVRVADSHLFHSLGVSGTISKAQHCRSEVFLDDTGWFPIDPADVRKVILEQKMALDSPEVRALRENLFGKWEMNWVGYNSATDIALPDAMGHQKPNFAFLMYPCAFTSSGQPDCLDPDHFRYEITSRAIEV